MKKQIDHRLVKAIREKLKFIEETFSDEQLIDLVDGTLLHLKLELRFAIEDLYILLYLELRKFWGNVTWYLKEEPSLCFYWVGLVVSILVFIAAVSAM